MQSAHNIQSNTVTLGAAAELMFPICPVDSRAEAALRWHAAPREGVLRPLAGRSLDTQPQETRGTGERQNAGRFSGASNREG